MKILTLVGLQRSGTTITQRLLATHYTDTIHSGHKHSYVQPPGTQPLILVTKNPYAFCVSHPKWRRLEDAQWRHEYSFMVETWAHRNHAWTQHPMHYHVRHEDIVVDPEGFVERIGADLGLTGRREGYKPETKLASPLPHLESKHDAFDASHYLEARYMDDLHAREYVESIITNPNIKPVVEQLGYTCEPPGAPEYEER